MFFSHQAAGNGCIGDWQPGFSDLQTYDLSISIFPGRVHSFEALKVILGLKRSLCALLERPYCLSPG